jgi:hypothetical protein
MIFPVQNCHFGVSRMLHLVLWGAPGPCLDPQKGAISSVWDPLGGSVGVATSGGGV